MAEKKLLVIQVAALSPGVVESSPALAAALPGPFQPLAPVFPAVTSPAQATFRTGLAPAFHGIIANGIYDRVLRRVGFWEQSARLIASERRIWEGFRRRGGRVGLLFWQQSLGGPADLVLSPAPIHKHGGGMIQDCYSQPARLYGTLCRAVGRPFPLMHYWGPMASRRSSEWIAAAGEALLARAECPELLFIYLPHLDYALQKHGPNARDRVRCAGAEAAGPLRRLVEAGRRAGRRILVWGDYAIQPVRHAVFPNRLLREGGLFRVREVRGRLYPDLYASRAFAVVDHQVAHLYATSEKDAVEAERLLSQAPGVDAVLPHSALPHPRSGERILVAAPDAWFAYPWWDSAGEAPDYAVHVDIHNKPGYDPCELFWGGLVPPRISLDPGRVRGSHGRPDAPAGFAADLEFDRAPEDLLELSLCVRDWLDRGSA